LNLKGYIEFSQQYLEFAASSLQATIVSQNEQNYCFYQYRQDGNFNITRPINTHLMYSVDNSAMISDHFLNVVLNVKDIFLLVLKFLFNLTKNFKIRIFQFFQQRKFRVI